MADIPPPEEPGWYADAGGAWWWWDGAGWTPQMPPSAWGAPDPQVQQRTQERTMALVMWAVYMLGGSFIAALVFYFAMKDKRFVRHHAAEALNLTLLILVFQLVGLGLAAGPYIDWIQATVDDPNAELEVTTPFIVGIVLVFATAVLSYGYSIAGMYLSYKGRWRRLPILLHPVRGAVRKGEEPYSVEPPR